MDTTGFVLKYWFAMPQIQTKNYESISAFLGFCTFFLNLLKRLNPKLIVCTFDESLGTCFRNKIFPDYKKNREKAPQELKIQFKLCREFLNLIGINNMASEKYEADDIINTLSINNRKYGISNTILTNDKDLFQTIYDDDFWWDLNNKKYNHKDLKKKLSFSPQNLTDFLGLMGDSVDNIPGAPGIGEKTAAVLINKYKNIDNIFDNINLISSDLGKKFHRYVNIIIENKEIIYLSKKLATLEYIDTIKSDNKLFERHEVNLEEVDSFLTKTGMRLGQKDSWINQIKSLCEVI
ncbi:MAG: 5'-3' exonuclease H3TH domain-containing protein [Pseudomonadota bacterium]|nr:5'-3' exonuclease H3TH domain-containing protein [Pseudomonadota bacterium]MED5430452.1 5'-3' exonuclease H3TH domain-containing protein [Pseudomonadota bacterium]